MRKNRKNRGFVFLEVLVAVALISIVFITLLGIAFSSVGISTALQRTTRADALVREEMEALRSFRDGTAWGTGGLGTISFGSGNPYYLLLDSSSSPAKWSLQAGTESISIFTRKVVFDKVSRDPSSQDIESVYNPAHNDTDTVKATVTVTWSGRTMQVVTYLTNWQK